MENITYGQPLSIDELLKRLSQYPEDWNVWRGPDGSISVSSSYHPSDFEGTDDIYEGTVGEYQEDIEHQIRAR